MKCICGYEQEEDFDVFEYEKENSTAGYMQHWIIQGLYICPKCGTAKVKVKEKE